MRINVHNAILFVLIFLTHIQAKNLYKISDETNFSQFKDQRILPIVFLSLHFVCSLYAKIFLSANENTFFSENIINILFALTFYIFFFFDEMCCAVFHMI